MWCCNRGDHIAASVVLKYVCPTMSASPQPPLLDDPHKTFTIAWNRFWYSNFIEQANDKMSDSQMANDHSCLIITVNNETPRGEILDATMQAKISSRTRCQLRVVLLLWQSPILPSPSEPGSLTGLLSPIPVFRCFL